MDSKSLYFGANRQNMENFLPEKYSKVLEVGCGSGNFSNVLRRRSCEVWGVEPHPEAADRAKAKMDTVLNGTYSDVEHLLPNNYFDLVVCNDVIEHMPDHDLFLEKIKSKMTCNSYLVGSIPNILHITSFYKLFIKRDWPYSESGILDRTHLRFFTMKSLKRTLKSHSYVIIKYAGINSIIKNGLVSANKSFISDIGFRTATLVFIALTLGYYYDSQYPQIGFMVKLEN